MSDKITTMAENQEKEKRAKIEQRRREREEKRKKYIPLSALIVANIIFLSLDIRAFQAIYLLTASYLLAVLTVLISGGLAMYWFDILYPHSRRHENETQVNLSIVSTVLAIGLSGVLAFADYVVGTGANFSGGWSFALWGGVILLTIWQGVAIAWWWSIDNHIDSEAKIQKTYAEEADKNDEIESMRTKLRSLRGFLDELDKLNTDYSPDSVRAVANLLGVTLPDNGRPSKPGNERPQPSAAMPAMAQEVNQVKENFTPGRES